MKPCLTLIIERLFSDLNAESGLVVTVAGALDTWTVHIVPKHQALQNPANKISLKQVVQPFEQTFRFQVASLVANLLL